MNSLISDILQGVARHGATALGGYLVAHGLMESSQLNGLEGSVIFLAGLAWSAWQKYQAQQKVVTTLTAASAAPPQGGV